MVTARPRLRRLFTVSGSSTETVDRHIEWGANARQADAFIIPVEQGAWYADALIARGFALPDSVVLASGLVAHNAYNIGIQNPTVSPDGSDQEDVPALNETLANLADRAHWLRVTTPDSGDSYVEFNVIRITVFVDQPAITVVEVGPGTLVGDDFTLGPTTYTTFSFERHTAPHTVEVTTDRKAWGELTERGSVVGILDITTSEPTTTGSQETGEAVIRYNADLAIGTELTDDLGRVWSIDGSRTIADRRYLEFSLTRQVVALDG